MVLPFFRLAPSPRPILIHYTITNSGFRKKGKHSHADHGSIETTAKRFSPKRVMTSPPLWKVEAENSATKPRGEGITQHNETDLRGRFLNDGRTITPMSRDFVVQIGAQSLDKGVFLRFTRFTFRSVM